MNKLNYMPSSFALGGELLFGQQPLRLERTQAFELRDPIFIGGR